jgi:hypothetical protein
VILSLADAAAGRERDGYNVVIHELAHKLDMRNGVANGHPPLHPEHEQCTLGRGPGCGLRRFVPSRGRSPSHPAHEPPIDPYGSESPAEFFAVCSETFFELPHLLRDEYPRVYAQLSAFYRQDPAPTIRGDHHLGALRNGSHTTQVNAPTGAPSQEEAPARRPRRAQIGIALLPNDGEHPKTYCAGPVPARRTWSRAPVFSCPWRRTAA